LVCNRAILGFVSYTMLFILASSQIGLIGLAFADNWTQFMHDSSHSSATTDTGLGNYRVSWAVPTGGRVSSSPACYDVDLDGKLETAITSYDGNLYLLSHDGNVKWQKKIGGELGSSPAIGNFFGDAMPEIVFGGDDGVYAYSAGGVKLWYYNTNCGVVSSPVLYDIDLDGTDEIVVGGLNGHLYALEGNGILKFDLNLDGSEIYSSPACVNLNGDQYMDLVVGTYGGKVYGVSNSGSVLWSARVNGPVYSSPAIRDMDVDGHLDIVINSQYNMYVFDFAGIEMWNYSVSDELWASPVLMDSNSNNEGEVYVGTFGNRFICVENRGLMWQTNLQGAVFSSAAICNINGDGLKDLIFGDSTGRLYALSSDTGNEIFAITLTDAIDSSPACCDVDKDGYAEIIVASVDGIVWCISNKGVTDSALPKLKFGFPSSGSFVAGNVSVLVNAEDNIGVSKVVLHYWNFDYMDWVLVGVDSTANDGFTFRWDTTSLEKDLRYELRAIAFDNSMNYNYTKIELMVKEPTNDVSCDMSVLCSPSVAEPVEGMVLELSVEIGNDGPSDGSGTVEVYIDSSRIFIFNFTMRQGESDRVIVIWNTMGWKGDRTINVKITNVHPYDIDEGNNVFTHSITVAPAPPPVLPPADLYISAADISFSKMINNITQNETCKIIVNVHNAGPNSVNARVQFVSFYENMTADRAEIIGATHISIENGTEKNASIDWIPSKVGKYYILVSVEITSQHKDPDEMNNEACVNVTVKVKPYVPPTNGNDDDDKPNNTNETNMLIPIVAILAVICLVVVIAFLYIKQKPAKRQEQRVLQKGRYDGDIQQYRSYSSKIRRNR